MHVLHLRLSQCWRCRWKGWSVQVPGGSSPSQSKLSSAPGPPPRYEGASTPSGFLTVTSAAAAQPSKWVGPSCWSVQRRGSGAGALRRVAWWRTAPLWPSSGGNTGAPNSGASAGRTKGAAAHLNPPTTRNTVKRSEQSLSLDISLLTYWLRKTLTQRFHTHTLTRTARLNPQSRCAY